MDHDEAVRMNATERYLLGELTPREHEAFEEHFFECAECAADVRLAYQFRHTAKAVFAENPRPVQKHEATFRRWFSLDWMSTVPLAPVACLALFTVVAYQNVVTIPRLQSAPSGTSQPEVVASAVLAPSSRGVVPAIFVPAGARFFHLTLDVRPVNQFENYFCELRTRSGAALWRLPISTLDPTTGLALSVPTKTVSPGSYDAVLAGIAHGKTTEIDHYRFDVRRP